MKKVNFLWWIIGVIFYKISKSFLYSITQHILGGSNMNKKKANGEEKGKEEVIKTGENSGFVEVSE